MFGWCFQKLFSIFRTKTQKSCLIRECFFVLKCFMCFLKSGFKMIFFCVVATILRSKKKKKCLCFQLVFLGVLIIFFFTLPRKMGKIRKLKIRFNKNSIFLFLFFLFPFQYFLDILGFYPNMIFLMHFKA